MDCKEAKELLSVLADGEIADNERENIMLHIAECDECRREYEELRSIKKEFARLQFRLNGELADSVMEKVTAEAHPKKSKPFIMRHVGTAAALIIVAGMFLLTKNVSQDNKVAESESVRDNSESVTVKGDYMFSSPATGDMIFEDYESVEETTSDGLHTETFEPESEAPMESMPQPSLKAEAPEQPVAEGMVEENENGGVNDFRLSNSISSNTAIIFVDSDIELLTPLFDSIQSIGSNCINLNQPHTEVMQMLYSNSITVTATDIPESTTDTTVYVQ